MDLKTNNTISMTIPNTKISTRYNVMSDGDDCPVVDNDLDNDNMGQHAKTFREGASSAQQRDINMLQSLEAYDGRLEDTIKSVLV